MKNQLELSNSNYKKKENKWFNRLKRDLKIKEIKKNVNRNLCKFKRLNSSLNRNLEAEIKVEENDWLKFIIKIIVYNIILIIVIDYNMILYMM